MHFELRKVNGEDGIHFEFRIADCEISPALLRTDLSPILNSQFLMIVLGINAYHGDSAACLVIDGKLVGASLHHLPPRWSLGYIVIHEGCRRHDSTRRCSAAAAR